MISRAGESYPYFIQDKEVAEKMGSNHFFFTWIIVLLVRPEIMHEVDQKENLICTDKLLGHKLWQLAISPHIKKQIESEELEMHVAWRISAYSTHFQSQKTNSSLNDPTPSGSVISTGGGPARIRAKIAT